jgi:hypothetical protein
MLINPYKPQFLKADTRASMEKIRPTVYEVRPLRFMNACPGTYTHLLPLEPELTAQPA